MLPISRSSRSGSGSHHIHIHAAGGGAAGFGRNGNYHDDDSGRQGAGARGSGGLLDKLQLFLLRVRLFVRSNPKRAAQVAIPAVVGVVLILLVLERIAINHIPIDNSVSSVAMTALFQSNPRISVSSGITRFSMREFSRVCCDYGPTVFRDPTVYEKMFKKFGQGERGLYDYAVALDEFLESGKTSAKVFVPTAMMTEFIEHFFLLLPVESRIVLVTGQEDCGPIEIFGYGRKKCELDFPISMQEFLDDDRLVHWFAQNYDLRNCNLVPAMSDVCREPVLSDFQLSKVEPIPLGIDFHTTAEKRFSNREHPREQEALLHSLPKMPWDKKALKVLAQFTVHYAKPDRMILASMLEGKDCIDRPKSQMSREQFWDYHNAVSFVFAPQGNGIDTHRLYEAISQRTVPVVRSSPLDSLYEKLPVVILDSWESFTSCDLLETWKLQIQQKFGQDPFSNQRVKEMLQLDYWKEQVHLELQN